MKKLNVLAAINFIFCANAVWAQNTSYNPQTDTVTIPAVEINGVIEYVDVVLQFNSEGLLRIVEARLPEDAAPNPPGGPKNYPFDSSANFTGQYVGGVFFLNDGSMWAITGVSNNISVGNGSKDLTIYRSSDAIPGAWHGVRADYFMLVNGNPTTYFVNKL